MRNYIADRLIILKSSIVYTFQIETAYAFNNLFMIVGALGFSVTNLVFNEIIFTNVTSVGGYNKDQMIFFSMVGTFNYFFNRSFSYFSVNEMIRSVNSGAFDLVLIRPIPSLLYTMTKKISIITFIKEGVFGTLVFSLAINNWVDLNITPANLFVGISILILGHYCLHFSQFLFAIPVFWFGESSNLLDFTFVLDYRLSRFVPYDAIYRPLQLAFSTVIPVLFTTGVATSVMLGKKDALTMFIFSLVITSFALILENIIWRKALKSYTSASS